jgi:hypothetical protein
MNICFYSSMRFGDNGDMAVISQKKMLEYARGSARILRRSIELYDQGERVFYRVMAVELRLLLCDTTRRHDKIYDLSLAPRLFPNLALSPLNDRYEFDLSGARLPLEIWLAQSIPLNPTLTHTLRQLVRGVCDQDGGAHVDRRTTCVFLPEDSQAEWMRKIAGVVLAELEKVL